MAEIAIDPPVTPDRNESCRRSKGRISAGNPGSSPGKNSFGSRNMSKIPAAKPGSPNNRRREPAHHRRGSIGSPHPVDSARRFSAEKSGPGKVIQSKVPRCLRASAGSCHDKCKNGDPGKASLVVKPAVGAKSCSAKFKATSDVKTGSSRQETSSGGSKTRPLNSPAQKKLVSSTKVEVGRKEGDPTAAKRTCNSSLKSLSSLQSKPVKAKPMPASGNSDGIQGKGRRNGDVGRKITAPRVSAINALASLNAPSSPKVSQSDTAASGAGKPGRRRLLSPRKDRSRVDRVEIETSNGGDFAKTLQVSMMGSENNSLGSVTDGNDIPSLSSASPPASLPNEKSPSVLSHGEDDEEIDHSGNEADESVCDDAISVEIDKVQPVEEDHNNILIIGTESIAVPSPTYESSSHERFPSVSSDDEEIKHRDGDTDEFASDNTREEKSVEEDRNQTFGMETESNLVELIVDGSAIPALLSPSADKSSREDDDEEIKHGGDDTDEYVSGNTATVNAGKERSEEENHNQSIPDDHAIPALPSPSTYEPSSLANSPSLVSSKDFEDEIKQSDDCTDEYVPDKTAPMESVPDDSAIPAPPSPSTYESSPRAKCPSLLSFEDDDEELNHSGNDKDGFVSDSAVPVNIGKEKSAEGNRKTLRKSRVVLSEDEYCSTVKLKSTRRKASDLQLSSRMAQVNDHKAEDFISGRKNSVKSGKAHPVKESDKRTLRKSRVTLSENCPSVKVFRGRKVVDQHSRNNNYSNNNPRRIGFRMAKALGAEEDKGDADDAGLASMKVTLKHQDVQEKETQGLFNNVIEETASKLVESRKGKVKALVGAFETVISILQCEPSSPAVS